MFLEYLNFNGYGQFVWPAFFFSFVTFYVLYYKSKKELQIQEKKYLNEFKIFKPLKVKTFVNSKPIKNILLKNTSF